MHTGDLGGFLGLLIGASVITIVEVLDLVFYNVVEKLFGKKKKNEINQRDPTDQQDQRDQIDQIVDDPV